MRSSLALISDATWPSSLSRPPSLPPPTSSFSLPSLLSALAFSYTVFNAAISRAPFSLFCVSFVMRASGRVSPIYACLAASPPSARVWSRFLHHARVWSHFLHRARIWSRLVAPPLLCAWRIPSSYVHACRVSSVPGASCPRMLHRLHLRRVCVRDGFGAATKGPSGWLIERRELPRIVSRRHALICLTCSALLCYLISRLLVSFGLGFRCVCYRFRSYCLAGNFLIVLFPYSIVDSIPPISGMMAVLFYFHSYYFPRFFFLTLVSRRHAVIPFYMLCFTLLGLS